MKEFKTKPKQFYSYVREKQKVKVGVTQLEKTEQAVIKRQLMY